MSTKWRKILLCITASFYLSITCVHAEEVGEAVVSYFGPGNSLTVSKVFSVYPTYSDRQIESIDLYVVPGEMKNSQVILTASNQTQAKTLTAYEPDSIYEVLPLNFPLTNIKQKDLTKITFTFSIKVAVTKVVVNYKGNPQILDIEASSYKLQLDRLEKLSKQNLYADVSNSPIDLITRVQAARELTFFPSLRAARILLERYNYRGVWADGDLTKEANKSIEAVVEKLIASLGEEKTMPVLIALFDEDEEFSIRNYALERMNNFKTSAALYFVIVRHTYSPTPGGIYGSSVLETIYQKSDFPIYAEKYKTKILDLFNKDVEFPYGGQAELIWAGERACTAFSMTPLSGIIATLWQYTNYSYYRDLAGKCSAAVNVALDSDRFDIAEEINPILDKMIALITDPTQSTIFWAFQTESHRILTVKALGKSQLPKAKVALQQALTVPQLEPKVKAAIVEALSWYK